MVNYNNSNEKPEKWGEEKSNDKRRFDNISNHLIPLKASSGKLPNKLDNEDFI